jgi:hypothetical protein
VRKTKVGTFFILPYGVELLSSGIYNVGSKAF